MSPLNGTGRVADDLYLLAHDEVTGKPRLNARAAGLGLAGALLAELELSDNIRLQPDWIMVADRAPPPDRLARAVLGLIASEPGRLAARECLLFLARTAAGDVALRLEQAGYLRRESSRRAWRGDRWVPVNSNSALAPVVRVKAAMDPAQPGDARNAALAGLAAACGLAPHLAPYLPPKAHDRLEEAALRLQPSLRDLIARTQAAVDSALLSQRL